MANLDIDSIEAVSGDEAIQTAVMSALPHAVHPTHGNWRAKADAFILGLRQQGFDVVRFTVEDSATPALHQGEQRCGMCQRNAHSWSTTGHCMCLNYKCRCEAVKKYCILGPGCTVHPGGIVN